MTSELIPMSFDNDLIGVVEENGQYFVAMKPVCEALGLDWSTQRQIMKDDPVLGSMVGNKPTVGKDGKEREMVCLPLNFLNGWLFKIDASRYEGERRGKIMRYQRECYEVLADHFLPRISAEENKAIRIEFNRLLERQDFLEAQVDSALGLASKAWGYVEQKENLAIFEKALASGKLKMSVFVRLKNYRTRNGLTQKEAAKLLGINRHTIQKYERLAKKAGLLPSASEKMPLVPEVDSGFVPPQFAIGNQQAEGRAIQ